MNIENRQGSARPGDEPRRSRDVVQRGDPAFRTTSAFELPPILVDTVDRRLLALDAATDRACAVLQTVTPP